LWTEKSGAFALWAAQVEHVAPFTVGPGAGKGKIETWTCAGGFNRWCYETVGGNKQARNCNNPGDI